MTGYFPTELAPPEIAAFATQGPGGDDETRLRALLGSFNPCWLEVRRGSVLQRLSSFQRIVEWIGRHRPELVVMEGTGLAGGAALILAHLLYGTRFVVSGGDAVGPFVGSRMPWLRGLFEFYEFLLYHFCAGFIGWTPYLTGRALSRGAPRAMTAPGWAPFVLATEERERERRRIRDSLGIPEEALVIGIAGSLAWNPRVDYCYGYEILQALRRPGGERAHGLVVGTGQGLALLRDESARSGIEGRFHLTGRVSRQSVPSYLAAMDVGSLPQSCDRVGSFRYTTKLSEYLAAGLPVVTGRLPLAYDLDDGWLWRLPGDEPWGEDYVSALARWLGATSLSEIKERRARVPSRSAVFEPTAQIARVTSFIRELREIAPGSTDKAPGGSGSSGPG